MQRKNTASEYQFPLEQIPDVTDPAIIEGAKHLESYLYSVLTTEESHPYTIGMAELAQNDFTLPDIINACAGVDVAALWQLNDTYLISPIFQELVAAMRQTLAADGCIYLAGCGSSGRLAMSLEKICSQILPINAALRIHAVLAGGDIALVSAVERFEDKGEYGARQLQDQGFRPERDLYIGISASGSAKFNNIPIAEQAARVKAGTAPLYLKPWLICCNDATKLEIVVKEQYRLDLVSNPQAKSPHPLADASDYVKCLGLNVGPNALAGSSRMQSATVSQIALFYALQAATSESTNHHAAQQLPLLIARLKACELSTTLLPFIMAEADCYQAGHHMVYETDDEHAMTIFTDLTERSPTFKLHKIENSLIRGMEFAWSTLSIVNIEQASTAFSAMLGRPPIALNWKQEPMTAAAMLAGYDFSRHIKKKRAALTNKPHHTLRLRYLATSNEFEFTYISPDGSKTLTQHFDTTGLDELSRHMLLKMILNIHSTLVMGRIKRYSSNLMTHLNVSNAKLFARAVNLVTQNIAVRLRQRGLSTYVRHIETPGVPVNQVTQAVAMVVAENLMHGKAWPSNLSIVTQSTQSFLIRSGLLGRFGNVFNLEETDSKEESKEALPTLAERKEHLNTFFHNRLQLSQQVIQTTHTEPYHNGSFVQQLFRYVNQNQYIPAFLTSIAQDQQAQAGAHALLQAVRQGNHTDPIFSDKNCYLYLLHLIKENKIPYTQGLTVYYYLMALMQFTNQQPLSNKDEQTQTKAILNIQVVPIHINGVLTQTTTEYLRLVGRSLKDATGIRCVDALEEYALTLQGTDNWLITIPLLKSSETEKSDASLYDRFAVLALVTWMHSSAPYFKSYYSTPSSALTFIFPSYAIIQFCLQLLRRANLQPLTPLHMFGRLKTSTVDKLHEQGIHPIALYAPHVQSNLTMVHGAELGPLGSTMHDYLHLYWGSTLPLIFRKRLFTFLIPNLEKLKDRANQQNDTATAKSITSIMGILAEFDLNAFVNEPVAMRCNQYLKMPLDVQTSGSLDNLLFLLEYARLSLQPWTAAEKELWNQLTDHCAKTVDIAHPMSHVIKKLAYHAVNSFSLDVARSPRTDINWGNLLDIVNANQESETLWKVLTQEHDTALSILMDEYQLVFYHPYQPMTAAYRAEFTAFLTQKRDELASLSPAVLRRA